MPLMVLVMATVLACVLGERADGEVAADSVDEVLKSYGSKYRLVATN